MKTPLKLLLVVPAILLLTQCDLFVGIPALENPAGNIAGYERATEEVLREIPEGYINTARENYHVAYEHTSHGTHVSRGVFGLQDYKTGDESLFAVSLSNEAGKLHFSDAYLGGGISGAWNDLSFDNSADNWTIWLNQNRAWLDDDSNEIYNVVMWSWCDISTHWVDYYCTNMQTLIDEYGEDGSKIGVTRANPITFIFMTGHANEDSNTGEGNPREQAAAIIEYCEEHGYYCLDYYSIDTHDMAGNYWEDASDNAYSASYLATTPGSSGYFYQDWQSAHSESVDWFYSKESPGGSVATGAHNESPANYITANRKAYAFWWILARLAGWDGT